VFSLALMVTAILCFTIFIGPITYFLAKIKFPRIIIYLLSLLSIIIGINFCLLITPVWYIGLLPIYCGYLSIRSANQKTIQG